MSTNSSKMSTASAASSSVASSSAASSTKKKLSSSSTIATTTTKSTMTRNAQKRRAGFNKRKRLTRRQKKELDEQKKHDEQKHVESISKGEKYTKTSKMDDNNLDDDDTDESGDTIRDYSTDSDDSSDSDSDSDSHDRRSKNFFRPSRINGTRVNSYELIKRLAHGGFAKVYVAKPHRQSSASSRSSHSSSHHRQHSNNSNETVVLKIFRLDFPEIVEQEIDLMRKIRNDHVIRSSGLQTFRHHHQSFEFISLPRMEMDMKKLLKYIHLSLKIVLNGMLSIVDGLKAIHKTGFIHYDLKPENILVNFDSETQTITSLKISDLGSAVRPNAKGQPPDIGFSLSYAAPEQLTRCNACTTFRTDVFALGCIFYEMLTCQTLFLKSHDDNIYHMAEAQALQTKQTDSSKRCFPKPMLKNQRFFTPTGALKYNSSRVMLQPQWYDGFVKSLDNININLKFATYLEQFCALDSRQRPTLDEIQQMFQSDYDTVIQEEINQ